MSIYFGIKVYLSTKIYNRKGNMPFYMFSSMDKMKHTNLFHTINKTSTITPGIPRLSYPEEIVARLRQY